MYVGLHRRHCDAVASMIPEQVGHKVFFLA